MRNHAAPRKQVRPGRARGEHGIAHGGSEGRGGQRPARWTEGRTPGTGPIRRGWRPGMLGYPVRPAPLARGGRPERAAPSAWSGPVLLGRGRRQRSGVVSRSGRARSPARRGRVIEVICTGDVPVPAPASGLKPERAGFGPAPCGQSPAREQRRCAVVAAALDSASPPLARTKGFGARAGASRLNTLPRGPRGCTPRCSRAASPLGRGRRLLPGHGHSRKAGPTPDGV